MMECNYQSVSPCVLPGEIVEKNIMMGARSKFVKTLESIFDPIIAEGLVRQYNLGVTKNEETIFYQKDIEGRFRGGKVIQHNPAVGKRIRNDDDAPGYWIHPLFIKKGYIPENWFMTQCLFGEHLLADYPEKDVCLVEDEETAIICCGFLPEYNWLATGGKKDLDKRLKVLKGRNVKALPDIDAIQAWTDFFDSYTGADIFVEDIYGEESTEEDREDRISPADILLRWHQSGEPNTVTAIAVPPVPSVPFQNGMGRPASHYKNPVVNQVAKYFSSEKMPEIEALIEDLDLEPISIQHLNQNIE